MLTSLGTTIAQLRAVQLPCHGFSQATVETKLGTSKVNMKLRKNIFWAQKNNQKPLFWGSMWNRRNAAASTMIQRVVHTVIASSLIRFLGDSKALQPSDWEAGSLLWPVSVSRLLGGLKHQNMTIPHSCQGEMELPSTFPEPYLRRTLVFESQLFWNHIRKHHIISTVLLEAALLQEYTLHFEWNPPCKRKGHLQAPCRNFGQAMHCCDLSLARGYLKVFASTRSVKRWIYKGKKGPEVPFWLVDGWATRPIRNRKEADIKNIYPKIEKKQNSLGGDGSQNSQNLWWPLCSGIRPTSPTKSHLTSFNQVSSMPSPSKTHTHMSIYTYIYILYHKSSRVNSHLHPNECGHFFGRDHWHRRCPQHRSLPCSPNSRIHRPQMGQSHLHPYLLREARDRKKGPKKIPYFDVFGCSTW